MRYDKKLFVPALASVAALGLLAIPASRALAGNAASGLKLDGFTQVVADPATKDIYLNGSSGITIVGSDGTVVGTLDSGYSVAGLALNGSTLYAVNSTKGDIDQFDVSAPSDGQAAAASYPLTSGDTPQGLAFAGGELWVSYTSAGGNGIGSIDPSSGTFTASATSDSPAWSSAPALTSDPSGSGTSVIASAGSTSETYTASSSGLTASSPDPAIANYAGDVTAIASDGTVAASPAWGTTATVYGSDGTEKYAYPLPEGLEPGGLAWDGATLVSVTSDGTVEFLVPPTLTPSLSAPASAYTGYVSLTGRIALGGASLPAGTTATVSRTDPSGTQTTLDPVTVGTDGTFTVDDAGATTAGTYTYAVSYGGQSASATVNVAQNAATLKVPASATIGVDTSANLTGSVTLLGGSVPAGTTITVTRQMAGSTTITTLPSVTNGSTGSFSVPQNLGTLGTYTYVFTYNGGTAYGSATATEKVTVAKNAAPLTVSGPTTYTYEPRISVTAHLGSTYTNRTVAVYAQTVGSAKKLLKQATVSSTTGNLSVALTTPYTTTFTVVFNGDARYAARTVTHKVTVLGRVSLAINGWASYVNVGGIVYRLYHHTGHLDVDSTVWPNKYGECVWYEVQEYYGGAWHPNKDTPCAPLSAASKLSGYLSFTSADLGPHYRIRAHYLPPSSDTKNAANITGWQYLVVKN